MSDFDEFGEAARLYAGSFEIVTEMERLFRADINRFAEALYDAVAELVGPDRLHENEGATSSMWWLADDDSHRDQHPQLWVADWYRPEVVAPGRLTFTAIAPGADDAARQVYTSLADQKDLAGFCTRGKGGTWSLFTAQIAWSDATDGIGKAAEQIATVLQALADTEARLRG